MQIQNKQNRINISRHYNQQETKATESKGNNCERKYAMEKGLQDEPVEYAVS